MKTALLSMLSNCNDILQNRVWTNLKKSLKHHICLNDIPRCAQAAPKTFQKLSKDQTKASQHNPRCPKMPCKKNPRCSQEFKETLKRSQIGPSKERLKIRKPVVKNSLTYASLKRKNKHDMSDFKTFQQCIHEMQS